MKPSEFNFMDRYRVLEGNVILSGIQALVRIPIDQTRKDTKDGIKLGTYVSGYQGSPLGTMDTHFGRVSSLLEEHRIYFHAEVNEDIAATALNGTQLLEFLPHADFDGVLGMWFGKGPGVDRTGDAFRHGNFTGTSKYGAVLTLAGDDPSCKSSTIPSDNTPGLFDLGIPVLFPGNQQELLEMGLKGVGLSRYAGLWTALKIVTDVADSGSIVEVYPEQALQLVPAFEIAGKPFQKLQSLKLVGKASLESERQIFYDKSEAAKAYVYENEIDKITVRSGNDRMGFVSFGKSYYDLKDALYSLGLDDQALRKMGIRLYKMGMIAPVEPKRLREFADGLEEVVLVEEKRGFTEMLIRNELYSLPHPPLIYGKKDRRGQIMFHAQSELKVSEIVMVLARFLADSFPGMDLPARAAGMVEIQSRVYEEVMPRIPYFCSGCPHSTSTVNPEGEIAGAGIGCHAMAMWMGRGLEFITHMGGEGANWIGLSHFTGKEHFFQNIGDGTYFHSGSKSIEACINAGVNITFKILYNSAVAMTGGQKVSGGLDTTSLARKLEWEGVRKITIVTELPEKYPQKQISKKIDVVPKAQYPRVVEEMKDVKGVSVLIYDQQCAAEKRRDRKRGVLEIPRKRVLINEAVCEGCGDCGVKSNCLSVIPAQTEYGRKTQIHQSSCNFDYSCLKGDCPSFMTVELEEGADRITKPSHFQKVEIDTLPAPAKKVDCQTPYRILMVGIGGTGVVTASAILVAAAHLQGKYAAQLDQTGLAQKGGAVTSNISICERPYESSFRIPSGQTDLLLAFDFLASVSPDNLDRLDAARSAAIVNSHQTDTALTITDARTPFPEHSFLRHQLNRRTKAERNHYVDANQFSETLFATEQSNNIFMLGVAYQQGGLPVDAPYIEAAIAGNGVAVERNINAFRWGRKYATDPENAKAMLFEDRMKPESCKETALVKLKKFDPQQVAAMESLAAQFPGNSTLHEVLYPRVSDLILFQNTNYAKRYLNFIEQVHQAETTRVSTMADESEDMLLTTTVAKWLFKLMAYKDEYEVARLWTQNPAVENAKNAYQGRVKVSIHLHPPMLRKWGLKNKLTMGPWVFPFLKGLAWFKVLRSTPWDPFARANVRRAEAALIPWYENLVRQLLSGLTGETLQNAVVIASLPDNIRGYEEIKMENIRKTRKEAEEKIKRYHATGTASTTTRKAKVPVI